MFNIKAPRTVLAACLAMGFLGGAAFFLTVGAATHAGQNDSTTAAGPAVSPAGRELLSQFSAAFEAAAAKVNPSVVPIMSEQVTRVANPFGSPADPLRNFFGDDFFRRFFGTAPGEQKQVVHALGSGVIVSKDGYILTNNHVVDGADKLTVVLQDKQKYTAKVIGRDPQSDVAVIKINASDLPVATLGNSDDARVGQWVIAVGNPFQLMHTVTAGIVSAKGRSSVNLADYEDFIQTDASINPGNSGGALADLDGDVIGINTAIVSPSGTGGNVGIGFAIPINMAKSIMHQLVATGKVSRGFLGLLPQDIDAGLAKAMNLKDTKGCLVGDVNKDGPADKAGIRRGDVITKFNGTDVENSVQLRNLVAEAEPGADANVMILRDGRERDIVVKLGERPKSLAANTAGESSEDKTSAEKFGLSVQELTASVEKALGFHGEQGVVVASVRPESPADEAGIQKNDLIKEVNRASIGSVADFRHAIEHIGKHESVALLIRRGDATFYVALQVAS